MTPVSVGKDWALFHTKSHSLLWDGYNYTYTLVMDFPDGIDEEIVRDMKRKSINGTKALLDQDGLVSPHDAAYQRSPLIGLNKLRITFLIHCTTVSQIYDIRGAFSNVARYAAQVGFVDLKLF
jgi:hypothetical protein